MIIKLTSEDVIDGVLRQEGEVCRTGHAYGHQIIKTDKQLKDEQKKDKDKREKIKKEKDKDKDK